MAPGCKQPTRKGTLVPTSQYSVGYKYKYTSRAFHVFVYHKWKYTNEFCILLKTFDYVCI